MSRKLSLSDLDIQGKKVLMRVDFNVPLDAQGKITDDTRIQAALPSIRYVLDHGGALVLMTHLGRPKGEKRPEFSLKPVARRLSELLGREVRMATDCIGPAVREQVGLLKTGDVLLLENLRFHRAEEHPEKDPTFGQQLAEWGDLYVNDAFGTAHRKHASNDAVSRFFSEKTAAGFLMEKEIQFLGDALLQPKRPFYAIIGGAKISTKIGVLNALRDKVDALLIGGGMTYTFLKARGIPIGNSICEDDLLGTARDIETSYRHAGVKLLLPVDIITSDKIDGSGEIRVVDASEGIAESFEGVDIGPKTIELYTEALSDAATIFWNGPLGVFEVPAFSRGTNAIATAVASLNATTVVGGGDSVAAIQAAGLAEQISHISTGGGASLEYVEQGTLPAIEALSAK